MYRKYRAKQNKIKHRSALHFLPILVLPLPLVPVNSMICGYRIAANAIVFAFAFDGDKSALLREYNFGIFVSIMTITFQALVFVSVCCFQKSNVFEDMEVNYARTFESLMKNKAYFDVIECLKYGMFSIKETWVILLFFR